MTGNMADSINEKYMQRKKPEEKWKPRKRKIRRLKNNRKKKRKKKKKEKKLQVQRRKRRQLRCRLCGNRRRKLTGRSESTRRDLRPPVALPEVERVDHIKAAFVFIRKQNLVAELVPIHNAMLCQVVLLLVPPSQYRTKNNNTKTERGKKKKKEREKKIPRGCCCAACECSCAAQYAPSRFQYCATQ